MILARSELYGTSLDEIEKNFSPPEIALIDRDRLRVIVRTLLQPLTNVLDEVVWVLLSVHQYDRSSYNDNFCNKYRRLEP